MRSRSFPLCLSFWIFVSFVSSLSVWAAGNAVAPGIVTANDWGVILQAKHHLEDARTRQNPIANRVDLTLFDSAARSLLAESTANLRPESGQIGLNLQALIQGLTALRSATDAADAKGSEIAWQAILNSSAELEKLYDPLLLARARVLAERFRCPMHPDVTGPRGMICPKCGMPLDTEVRLQPISGPGDGPRPIVKIRVETDGPLRVGVKVNGRLSLTSITGGPITPEQLTEVHTRKIHLLIIDGSLTDYHHEHPVPTATPGQYDFSFTPQKPGAYRIWADVQPTLTGIQEFAMTVIPADTAAEPLRPEPDRLTATSHGLTYTLQFQGPVKSFEPVLGIMHITQADGTPFTQLEPVMGAFAHLVGFRDDRTTALHIHPETVRPPLPSDRGGPDLRFRFYAPKPGFYRLFVQVQRGGAQEFASFALQVARGPLTPVSQKNNCSTIKSSPTVFDYGIRITQITLRK